MMAKSSYAICGKKVRAEASTSERMDVFKAEPKPSSLCLQLPTLMPGPLLQPDSIKTTAAHRVGIRQRNHSTGPRHQIHRRPGQTRQAIGCFQSVIHTSL